MWIYVLYFPFKTHLTVLCNNTRPQDSFLTLYPVCDNSLSRVIGWASFSLVDERINLLLPHSFMEMEWPWLEFAAHLLSFTQGYLLKTMPSPCFHLSGCLTGPEAGFLLDTAWIMKRRLSGGDRQWVIMHVRHWWGLCSCFITSNVADGNPWITHPVTPIHTNEWMFSEKYIIFLCSFSR